MIVVHFRKKEKLMSEIIAILGGDEYKINLMNSIFY